MPIDVVIPTTQNETWLQRALISLVTNTDPDTLGKVIVMGDAPLKLGCAEGLRSVITVDESPTRRSCRDNWVDARKHITSPLALYMHDDAMVLPGNPGWLRTMAEPFIDECVGAVACVTNDSAGAPHMEYSAALAKGNYYTTWFTPIFVLAQPDPWTRAVAKMPEDMFGDLIPCLEMLMEGWRLIATNKVCQYHKGQQSNMRIYGGEDPYKWLESCRPKVREYMRAHYPEGWLKRIDACEMIPVSNYHVPRSGGSEVVMI